jgi:hypothetical protein
MPPKQKKNKAKIEAELKEQERLRELEEEERRRILQEEEEKKALEERIRLRNEEVDQFAQDMKQYDEILAKRNNEYFFKRNLFEDSQEWKEILTCDMKQFRTDVRHLNTFMTEWLETDICLNKLGSFFDEINDFILELSSELLHDRAMNYQVNATLNEFSSKFKSIVESSISTLTAECMEYFFVESGKQRATSFVSHCKHPFFGLFFHKRVGATTISSPGVTIDLPPSLVSSDQYEILIRIVKTPFYPCSQQRYNSGDIVVGGTFHVQLFRSYARSQLGGWKVMDNAQDESDLLDCLEEPVRCEVELPSNIVPSEATKIMSLDKNDNLTAADVDNVYSDFKNRKISFTFCRMGTTFAIAQARTQDFPYKNWSLTPSFHLGNEDSDSDALVDFCLDTTRFHIRIRIDGASCSLLEPPLPELDHLLERPMTPAKLLVSLSSNGVHIIPSDTDITDSKFLTDRVVEDAFCSDIALLSTAFDVKASQYNSKRIGGNVGIFQVKESNALKGFIDPFPMHLMKIELDSESTTAIEAPGSKLLPNNRRDVRYNLLEGEELCDSEWKGYIIAPTSK